MKYFLDTEFIEDGKTIDLISLGLAAEDGRELYLESAEAALERANAFVREHVLPKLGPVEKRLSRAAMRQALLDFVGDDREPMFVADYAAYDWIALCQLFGTMSDLPRHFPMFCLDLRQVLHFHPARADSEDEIVRFGPSKLPHHALHDAIWLRNVWNLALWTPSPWEPS